jgi:glutamine amidotransferase
VIAILDYGSGNLRSAQRAFETSGKEVVLTSDYDVALNADGLVVPGVGAFAACMQGLAGVRGDQLVRERIALKRPTLGICVGMQILFSKGFEKQESNGLSVLPGDIKPLKAKILPHIGWNSVKAGSGSKLFNGIENESFYFVHSYGLLEPITDAINTITNYEGEFISAVEMQNISAVQFHPEKSGQAGLNLLKNWVRDL